jgi:hypothetical protein
MPTRDEIAWAAGLFEGEGCFAWTGTPSVILGMTDRDIVERFAAIVGFGLLYEEPRRPPEQTLYRWRANGFENVQAVLAMLWQWLGPRRRARAVEVLRRRPSDHERALGRERMRRHRAKQRA